MFCIYHNKISSLMFRFWKFLIYIHLFRSIITRHDENLYLVWPCLLSWEVFFLIETLQNMLYNFNYAWISFGWKIWHRKENTSDVKNSKYGSIFFWKNLTQQNIVPLKPCIMCITFRFLYNDVYIDYQELEISWHQIIRNKIWLRRSKKMSSILL